MQIYANLAFNLEVFMKWYGGLMGLTLKVMSPRLTQTV